MKAESNLVIASWHVGKEGKMIPIHVDNLLLQTGRSDLFPASFFTKGSEQRGASPFYPCPSGRLFSSNRALIHAISSGSARSRTFIRTP
jgi:hypothetical protein